MASELYNTIDAISREKGIDPQIVVSAVEDAIVVATRKFYKTQENLRAELDKESGQIRAYAVKNVVDTPEQIEDPIKGSYVLEVSSPGLDRKLRGPADYERFKGSLLKLQTLEPVNGNRNYEGRLQNFDGSRLSLELPAKGKGKKQEPGGTVEIEFSNVAKANLVPEF